ncbi:MAG: PD40 domain-containing protein [Armatimonadetes bacterium]|nr:PD40 domain-containing protein [Armatimonadota bacterium]
MRRQRTLIGLLLVIILVSVLAYVRSQPWGQFLLFLPPDSQGWIVCERAGENDSDIVIVKPDGAIVELATGPSDDIQPDWSPDGNMIAFSSNKRDEVYQLFRIPASGGQALQLTVGGGAKFEPVYSANGDHILHIAQGLVTEVEPKTLHAEQIIPPSEMMHQWRQDGEAALSFRMPRPSKTDDRLFAAVQRADGEEVAIAHFIPPDRSRMRSPMLVTSAKRIDVDWSPKEAKLAMAVWEGEVQVSEERKDKASFIGMADFTQDPQQPSFRIVMALPPEHFASEVAFSPNGEVLAFVLNKTHEEGYERLGLVVVAATGGAPTPLTQGEAWQPSWTPDGQKIAIAFGPRGKRQIHLVHRESGQSEPITKDERDYSSPRVSPKK